MDTHDRWTAGFTIHELIISVILFAIVITSGATGYRRYNESIAIHRAASQIEADLALAKSAAIQRRANVSIVADEAYRQYEIRDDAGNMIVRRHLDGSSHLMIDAMDFEVTGDSITYNSRGMLVGMTSALVSIARGDDGQAVGTGKFGETSTQDASPLDAVN